ncbi:hypothetical protein GS400_07180 [Pontibacillus sp. HMF3514]|nr:hypothetical protein GS400_07180 [Pontibacillus sp. HMF3514]
MYFILIGLMTACNSGAQTIPTIKVTKLNENGEYNPYREIENPEKVKKVVNILDEIQLNWRDNKVSWSEVPQYQFTINHMKEQETKKDEKYEILFSIDRVSIYLFKRPDKYTIMSDKEAETLVEIITGETLAEPK